MVGIMPRRHGTRPSSGVLNCLERGPSTAGVQQTGQLRQRRLHHPPFCASSGKNLTGVRRSASLIEALTLGTRGSISWLVTRDHCHHTASATFSSAPTNLPSRFKIAKKKKRKWRRWRGLGGHPPARDPNRPVADGRATAVGAWLRASRGSSLGVGRASGCSPGRPGRALPDRASSTRLYPPAGCAVPQDNVPVCTRRAAA